MPSKSTHYLFEADNYYCYRSSWQGEEGIATKQASRERLAEMLDLLRVISCIVIYASLYK